LGVCSIMGIITHKTAKRVTDDITVYIFDCSKKIANFEVKGIYTQEVAKIIEEFKQDFYKEEKRNV